MHKVVQSNINEQFILSTLSMDHFMLSILCLIFYGYMCTNTNLWFCIVTNDNFFFSFFFFVNIKKHKRELTVSH